MSKLLPADPHHHGVPRRTDEVLRREATERYGKITPQILEEIVEEKVRTIANYLTPDKLRDKLADASLKEIAIYEGTFVDKLLLLRGQPQLIVSMQHQKKLDEIMPALIQEIQRRGLKAELTERKAVITVDAK